MNHKTNALTRRNFLRFTTGIGIAVGLDSFVPAYARQEIIAENTKQARNYPDIIDLKIQETLVKIGNKQAKALTVNGSVPGTLIRLREGQNVTINVTNYLKKDTSIHWHGILLPPNMDGVPGVSFAGIKPGQTFSYRFPVAQNGTYWYHSHSGLQEQRGHYGALIIDPIEPEPFEYDQDYVVLLSDWTFDNPHDILANLKKMPAYYNYQRRTIADLSKDLAWRRMRMDPTDIADVTGATYTYLMNGLVPDSNWTGLFEPGNKVRLRFINGSAMTLFDVRIPGLKMTVIQADGQNVQPVSVDEFRIGVAETYDVIVEPQDEEAYTIFAETMDRSGYARGTLAVRQGLSAPLPKLRERPLRTMADMGMAHDMSGMNSNSSMNHDISGMNGDSSMKDMPSMNDDSSMKDMPGMNGDSSMKDMPGMNGDSSMKNMPGMNGDSSMKNMPGMNHDMSNNPGVPHGPDNHGLGNATVPMMVKSRLHEPGVGLENTGHRVLVYTDLRSLKPGYDKRKPERELELHLTGIMERYMWSFDGKKYSEDKEITFYNGERLRLVFVNDSMMEHPIHLHGMWMELDNGAGEYKPRKHTIVVKPAERLPVEINVDAPGKWAFHCHLLYHMKVGMFRTVAVINRG